MRIAAFRGLIVLREHVLLGSAADPGLAYRRKAMTTDLRSTLRLETPIRLKIYAVALAGLSLALIVGLRRYWEDYTVVGRLGIIGGILTMLLAVVDQFQRVYELGPHRVRVRLMFLWRTVPLTRDTVVAVDALSRVIIRDKLRRRVVLTIPRGYYDPAAIARRIESLRDSG